MKANVAISFGDDIACWIRILLGVCRMFGYRCMLEKVN